MLHHARCYQLLIQILLNYVEVLQLQLLNCFIFTLSFALAAL